MKKKKVKESKGLKSETVGRPAKFTDPNVMQKAIDDYFAECEKNEKPKTIMGLALALDMCRDSLCEYEKDGRFSDIVKKAKARVVQEVEARLFTGNPTGAIFWLKNHAGYRDKADVEHSGIAIGPITINIIAGREGQPVEAIDVTPPPKSLK